MEITKDILIDIYKNKITKNYQDYKNIRKWHYKIKDDTQMYYSALHSKKDYVIKLIECLRELKKPHAIKDYQIELLLSSDIPPYLEDCESC